MNNLRFNQKFIKQTIDKGVVLLKNPFLSLTKRKNIKEEINILNNFLFNSFEEEVLILEKNNQSVEVLKSQILKNMKRQYRALGKDVIMQLIKLSESSTLEPYLYLPNGPQLTIEDQIEETLEMYKNYSEIFYTKANEIVSNSQIHIEDELNSNSWVLYSEILKMPLLVIDPCESSSIFVKTLQKAIEVSMKFSSYFLFEDLVPLYFELLFNDHVFSKYRIFSEGYFDRITDFEYNLKQIELYLELLLEFSKDDFKIDTERFLRSVNSIMFAGDADVVKYLNNEMIDKKIEKSLVYCVSFLKAVHLREKTFENKESALEELNSFFKRTKRKQEITGEDFVSYENFYNEINHKSKRL